MAIPRVFISSTFYDLKYIRENIRYFVKTLGYEPILSEEGSVYYDPTKHTQDSCLSEVPNCQLFVLIIGGRFGGTFKDAGQSITNAEYKEAIKLKIPVFSLVEQSVWAEHHVYVRNRENANVDPAKINYPSVDNVRIFDFIDEVRKNTANNAIVPFKNFGDIEDYLRQQWAGMMFSFLLQRNEASKVADGFAMLQEVNQRIEVLSRQILTSVGSESAKLTAELYDAMFATEAIRDLAWFGLHPTPATIIQHQTFQQCAGSLGKPITVYIPDPDIEDDEDHDGSLFGDGQIGQWRLKKNEAQYLKLRERLLAILKGYGLTPEDYLLQEKSAPPVSKLSITPMTTGKFAGVIGGLGDVSLEVKIPDPKMRTFSLTEEKK